MNNKSKLNLNNELSVNETILKIISTGKNVPYFFQHKEIFKEFKKHTNTKTSSLANEIQLFNTIKKTLVKNAQLYLDFKNNKLVLDNHYLENNIFQALCRQNLRLFPDRIIYSDPEMDFFEYLQIPGNDGFVIYYYNPSNLITGKEMNYNKKQEIFIKNYLKAINLLTDGLITNKSDNILINIHEIIFLLYLLGDTEEINFNHLNKSLSSVNHSLYQKHKEIHLLLIWHHVQNLKEQITGSIYGRVSPELKRVVLSYLSDAHQSDLSDKHKYNPSKPDSWVNIQNKVANAKKRQPKFNYDEIIAQYFTRFEKYFKGEKDLHKKYNFIMPRTIFEEL